MHDAATPPSRIPWPPLIYAGIAALALALGLWWPWPDWFAARSVALLGWLVITLGLGLDLTAMAVMAQHRANILPNRAATALVTRGPFAWSRNPIYLGNTLVLIGVGLAFGNPWFLAGAPIAVLAVTKLAIEPEERHLARLFGTTWEAYRHRTLRWFGRR